MKKILIVAAVILFIAVFASCAGAPAPSPDVYGRSEYDKGYDGETTLAAPAAAPAEAPDHYAYDEKTEAQSRGITDSSVIGGIQGTGPGDSVLQPSVNRKIVYNGSIEANTKEFDKDCDAILSTLQTFGGYVENSYIRGTKPEEWNDEGRDAQMTLRVPNSKFDSFILMLKGVGQNVSSSVSGQDISLQYYDTQTHLTMLENRKTRLEEMLKNPAYTLDSIIELERELSDVSYQIQMYETNLRTYDSLVDFSTINVTLHEVMEIKEVTPAKEDLGSRISDGFYSALNGLVHFGEDVLVFLAASWPVLVILIVAIFLIIFFVKRSNKKRGADKLPPIPPHVQGGKDNEEQG